MIECNESFNENNLLAFWTQSTLFTANREVDEEGDRDCEDPKDEQYRKDIASIAFEFSVRHSSVSASKPRMACRKGLGLRP